MIRAPVPLVNALYRIAVQGEQEYQERNRLQNATLTLPLSAWNAGKREQLRNMPSRPFPTYRNAIAFGAGTTGEQQRNPEFFSVLKDAVRTRFPR
jgi:hypothetical protein